MPQPPKEIYPNDPAPNSTKEISEIAYQENNEEQVYEDDDYKSQHLPSEHPRKESTQEDNHQEPSENPQPENFYEEPIATQDSENRMNEFEEYTYENEINLSKEVIKIEDHLEPE